MSTSRHTVSIDQLIALNDEIIALTKNGVPLESGLLQAGADFQGSITRLTIALASRMQKGETLHQAIEREPSNVPPIYRTIVEAGLRTGRLSVALEGVSRFARQIMEIRQMIGLSMMYPLIVVSFAYVLSLVFLGEVLARFRAFYVDSQVPYSLPIQILSSVSATSAYWIWIPPVLLIFLIWSWQRGNWVSMFQLSGPLQFLPGMKPFHRRLQLATFSDLLAILVEQQVPLPDALTLAAEASADPKLASSVDVFVTGIQNGLPNSDHAWNQQGLPPFIFWLLTSNQNSPTLVPALRQAGQMYRREALRQSDWMRGWFPVAAVVVVGGGAVLVYALVLYWPLVHLLGDLSR